MHALVIEDDGLTALFIEDELRDLGFTSVDIAATEEAAVAAVATRAPDLVTSDGSLLMGTGIGAVRSIRATLPVPVVFITGDSALARRSMPRAPVLEKPFTAADFARAVEQAMAGAAAC